MYCNSWSGEVIDTYICVLLDDEDEYILNAARQVKDEIPLL